MTALPIITIGIPTMNRRRLMEETLRSAIAQDYPNLRVIVADNSSSDGTETFLAQMCSVDRRISILRHRTVLPITENWNSILRSVSEGLFMLVSDDDVLEPGAVQRLASPLQTDCLVAMTYSPVLFIDQTSKPLELSLDEPPRERGDDYVRAELRRERFVPPSTIMFRMHDKKGRLLYPDIGTASDFLHRCITALDGDVVCIAQPLVRYRKHELNESRDYRKVSSSLLHMAEVITKGQFPLMTPYAPLVRQFVSQSLESMAVLQAISGSRTIAIDLLADAELFIGNRSRKRFLVSLLRFSVFRALAQFAIRFRASFRRFLLLASSQGH